MPAWEGIRVGWNVVSGRVTATYPDDGTFPFKEIAFAETSRTLLPGGPRLILGPTLGEIIHAFELELVQDTEQQAHQLADVIEAILAAVGVPVDERVRSIVADHLRAMT